MGERMGDLTALERAYKAGQEWMRDEALGIIQECREEGETDLRSVRARIEYVELNNIPYADFTEEPSNA